MIFGNPTFEIPNPNIDFTGLNVLPSKVTTLWLYQMLKRASVNLFGYDRSNAHAIVEHPNVPMPGFIFPHVSSYLDNKEDLLTPDGKESRNRQLFVFSVNEEMPHKSLTK